jgi:predicted alpha/beta-fold hydrolase
MVVAVGEGSAVRLEVDRPTGKKRGTLLLIHGMCGSAESGYMRRTARLARRVGWVSVRMNLRNCGGTEALATTLYNAGQSDDVGRVLAALDEGGFPHPFAAVGFSLGGNVLLRYAGLAGANAAAVAFAAVNPPIDLERCAQAIEQPRNCVYGFHYTVRLCRHYRRIQQVRDLPGPHPAAHRIRSVRRFDAIYTAPDADHDSAEAYYAWASASPRLAALRTPTLVLSAADDPFVPTEMFDPHRGVAGMRFLHPPHGGHCGYLQSSRPRYWAAEAILAFLARPGEGRKGLIPREIGVRVTKSAPDLYSP